MEEHNNNIAILVLSLLGHLFTKCKSIGLNVPLKIIRQYNASSSITNTSDKDVLLLEVYVVKYDLPCKTTCLKP